MAVFNEILLDGNLNDVNGLQVREQSWRRIHNSGRMDGAGDPNQRGVVCQEIHDFSKKVGVVRVRLIAVDVILDKKCSRVSNGRVWG